MSLPLNFNSSQESMLIPPVMTMPSQLPEPGGISSQPTTHEGTVISKELSLINAFFELEILTQFLYLSPSHIVIPT